MDCQVQNPGTGPCQTTPQPTQCPRPARVEKPARGSSRRPRSWSTKGPWPVSASTRSAGRRPRASRSSTTTSVTRTISYTPSSITNVSVSSASIAQHLKASRLGTTSNAGGTWSWGHRRPAPVRGGCPLGSLASELADLDEPSRTRLAHAFMAWEQLLSDGLAKMVEAGSLRADADAKDSRAGRHSQLAGRLVVGRDRSQHSTPRGCPRRCNRLLTVFRLSVGRRTERPILIWRSEPRT